MGNGKVGQTLRLQIKSDKVGQIQQHVRELVRAGQLRPGMRLPPERELAEQFGVSVPTVNKAMAGLAAERLLDRSPGRGTFVHAGASRGLVAVVFPAELVSWPQGSPFYPTLMDRLGSALVGMGFRSHFLLASGRGEDAARSLHPESVLWQHVVGVIAYAQLGSLAGRLAEQGVPLVGFSEPPGVKHLVVQDQFALGRLAGLHLAARGYRRLGLARYAAPAKGCQATEGFRQAVAEAGCDLREQHVVDAARGGGAEAFRRLWSLRDRPEAVFVADDCLAVGFAQAMREQAVQLPRDLAVITHATGGVPMEELTGFTRCQFDVGRTSRALCAMLDRLIRGIRPAPARAAMRPRIVQGSTT